MTTESKPPGIEQRDPLYIQSACSTVKQPPEENRKGAREGSVVAALRQLCLSRYGDVRERSGTPLQLQRGKVLL